MRFPRPWTALIVAGGLIAAMQWRAVTQESGGSSGGGGSGAAGGSSSGGSSSGGSTGGGSDTGGAGALATPFGAPGSPAPSGGSSSSPFGFGASGAPAPASAFGSTPSSSFGSATPSSTDTGTAPGGTSGATPGAPSGTTPGAPPIMAPSAATPPGPGTPNPYGFTLPATPAPPSSVYTGGTTEGPSSARDNAPVFTVPAAYGQAAQTLVGGQGRLARPRFATSGSMSVGYDDNVLSTPYNALAVKEVTAQVETAPAVPAHFVTLPEATINGRTPQVNGSRPLTVLVPEVPAKTKTVVVQPAVPAAKPIGSFALRANVNGEVQFSNRRTVFTMDATLGDTYYTSRPGSKNQYNGSLSALYSHRITPRMTFSATANVAYLNQPNLQLVNAPSQNQGDYFNANTKYNLSYRWTPRFSTVSSVSLDSQYFVNKSSAGANYYDVILGTEARYNWSRRLTVLAEVRYSMTNYLKSSSSALNSNSYYLLIGGETTLSRRLSASARAGEEVRSFTGAGGRTAASPYAETALSFRYSRTGFVSWTTRLGFEESQNANTSVEVLRSSINASQAFSFRTRGTVALAAVHRITTNNDANTTLTENTFQADLGLEYTLTRHCTLTANYSFINNLSTAPGTNYLRNQLFFGMQYAF